MSNEKAAPLRPATDRSTQHAVAVALLAAWLPAACLAISTKDRLLNPRGFQVASDQLKLVLAPKRDPATYFSYFDRLCLMRLDVTLAWAVVPALLYFVSRRLGSKAAAAFVVACSTTVTLLLFIQNRCLSTVGSFVTAGMLGDAIHWAMTEPSVASPYLLTLPNMKLVLAIALTVGAGFVSVRWAPRLARPGLSGRRSWLILVPGFVVALAAWYPAIPSSAAHKSALLSAATVLLSTGENNPGAFAGMSQADLAQQFRKKTNTTEASANGGYRGLAADFDVIIFMLETAPYRCVPIGDLPLSDFKTLTRLSRNAFVAPCHFTTYPKTNCALFSVLSGLYPPSREAFRLTGSHVAAPGLAATLRRNGYRTTLYTPVALTQADSSMFAALGISSVVVPANSGAARDLCDHSHQTEEVGQRIARDREILDAAKRDREACARANRRYLHVLMHQIGHAPWADLDGQGEKDVYRKGRALCSLQDRWLDEIVRHLESLGRLDRTLIVIAGDHGVRSRLEDPALHVHTMEELSFHVPLMVFCGKSLSQTKIVKSKTSHIDICPTLLTLLGLDFDSQMCEGTPLWQADESRTLFFWAREVMGFDGFVTDRQFSMYRPNDDLVSSGEQMTSESYHRVPCGSAEHELIVDRIHTMRAMQGQWTSNALAKSRRDSDRQ